MFIARKDQFCEKSKHFNFSTLFHKFKLITLSLMCCFLFLRSGLFLHYPLFFLSNHINIGPPITAVSIPAGNSSGAIIILPITSTHTTSIPPNSADTGRTFLWSLPTKSLVKCGTISPTNPIHPLTETVTPAISDAIITSSFCSLPTFAKCPCTFFSQQ